ncbi:MAG TPA: cytidylate kinase-like family protein [Terriglobales bacterium]|jgi:cytidylate kinase|nr:cytidylate kinase-like family protein [Terriglobales bacterium]
MQVRIVTLEREYGSGGAVIAKRIAQKLGWKLWDEELTAEIARLAKVDHKAAVRCDERRDSLAYRLFKVYARGSYERTLPIEGEPTRSFDADQMVAVLHKVVEDVASRGNSVIVGRGAPYILRNRPDAFHVFIYASEEEKVRRIMTLGKTEREAIQLVQEVDSERAAFIRHYFNKEWPLRSLYHLMINSKYGDEHTVETILHEIASVQALPVAQAAGK